MLSIFSKCRAFGPLPRILLSYLWVSWGLWFSTWCVPRQTTFSLALCHYKATNWKVASGTNLGQRGAHTVDFPCIKGHCPSIFWLCCCFLGPSNSFHPTSAFLILIKLRVGLVKFQLLHRTQKCKSNLYALSCGPWCCLGSNSGPSCLTTAFRA